MTDKRDCCSQYRYVIALLLTLLYLPGCGKSPPPPPAKNASPASLVKLIQIWKAEDLKRCDFTITKQNSASALSFPSPSDTQLELKGWAELSEPAAASLKADYQWEEVALEKVPTALKSTLPAESFQTSRKLNEQFEQNPTYRHGFVVISKKQGWSKIYFVATDLDHPLEMN